MANKHRFWSPQQPQMPKKNWLVSRRLSGLARQISYRSKVWALFLLSSFLVITLLLLALSSTQPYYAWFLLLALLLAAGLLGLVCLWVWRLYRDVRQQRFGTQLRRQMLRYMALIAILPGLLLYVMSSLYSSKVSEGWSQFDFNSALDNSFYLARAVLDGELSQLSQQGRALSQKIANSAQQQNKENEQAFFSLALPQQANDLKLDVLLVVDGQGAVRYRHQSAPRDIHENHPPSALGAQPSAEQMSQHLVNLQNEATAYLAILQQSPKINEQNWLTQPVALLDEADGFSNSYRLNSLQRIDGQRFLLVARVLGTEMAGRIYLVEKEYRHYQQQVVVQQRMLTIYNLTLFVTVLLSLLTAITIALLVVERISSPLAELASNVEAVRRGDFTTSTSMTMARQDELGFLARLFGRMTEDLAEASHKNKQQEQALLLSRQQLAEVVANLSSAIMTFDRHGRLQTTNQAAHRVLDIAEADLFKPRAQWPSRLIEVVAVLEKILDQLAQQPSAPMPPHSIEFVTDAGELRLLQIKAATLLPKTTPPHDDNAANAPDGFLVVIEDISVLVTQQRNKTWQEVARWLAHEIKNPLTPILLAAEHMQHRLAAKLADDEQKLLEQTTSTIVTHVLTLNRLIGEFRDYGKLLPPHFQAVDLLALLDEVVLLYRLEPQRFVDKHHEFFGNDLATTNDRALPVNPMVMPHIDWQPHTYAATALPPIAADPDQVRQVMHNLLKNAIESCLEQQKIEAQSPSNGQGLATPQAIVMSIGLEKHQNQQWLLLALQDTGMGIDANVLQQSLIPHMTTKPYGSGFGLAIVKKIVDEHGAKIKIQNRSDGIRGAIVQLWWPIYYGQPTLQQE